MEDMLKGRWKQMKGEIQKQWGKLTDDELAEMEGNKDKLIGKIQEKYGYTREQARMEVDSWMRDHDLRKM
jgi:uncharacterized protein YjbJ (UPF0337 family)